MVEKASNSELPYFFEVHDMRKEASFCVSNTEALAESLASDKAHFQLTRGGKVLYVDVLKDEFGVYAETQLNKDPEEEKVDLETTRIHKDAFILMGRIAGVLGKPINYRYGTKDPTMINWALSPSKGRRVFEEWDMIGFEAGRIEALKRIEPI